MLTFQQFLTDVAKRGGVVNTLFEERLFGLVGILHRITEALASESIPYQVVGGLAVLIHVEEANPEHSTLTRDVNIMIHRSDLERVKLAAEKHDFRLRHAPGVTTLIYGNTESAKNAVHFVFGGDLDPEPKAILGKDVMVIPVADLVRIKLTSNRDKDRVHIRSLDAAGLLTSVVEEELPAELQARLQHIRETE